MDLDQVRKRIEEQLVVLRRRAEKIDRDLRRENNPLSPDWSEQAVTRENDEVLDALDNEGREQIARLEEALERVKEGTYGQCSDCGGDIGEARLEALPQALECIDCARRKEG